MAAPLPDASRGTWSHFAVKGRVLIFLQWLRGIMTAWSCDVLIISPGQCMFQQIRFSCSFDFVKDSVQLKLFSQRAGGRPLLVSPQLGQHVVYFAWYRHEVMTVSGGECTLLLAFAVALRLQLESVQGRSNVCLEPHGYLYYNSTKLMFCIAVWCLSALSLQMMICRKELRVRFNVQ